MSYIVTRPIPGRGTYMLSVHGHSTGVLAIHGYWDKGWWGPVNRHSMDVLVPSS